MESILKWSSDHPFAFFSVVMVVLAVLAVTTFAVRRGYTVAFWPPKFVPPPRVETVRSDSDVVRDIGVIDYRRDSQELGDKAGRIRSASREVWMIGATMHYTIGNCRELILERVQAGVDFHLLIADPAGRDFESTARCFGNSVAQLRQETDMTLSACRDIVARLRQPKGSFHVRVMDRVFTAGVYFFDPQSSDAALMLVPHVPGHDAPLTPGLLFRRVPGGLLDDYFQIYKGIWNNATNAFS